MTHCISIHCLVLLSSFDGFIAVLWPFGLIPELTLSSSKRHHGIALEMRPRSAVLGSFPYSFHLYTFPSRVISCAFAECFLPGT